MQELRLLAPAKVNLALHVTGRRADGYHLLDSLVVFADRGDQLELSLAEDYAIRVTGPLAEGVPEDDRNLCIKAARAAGVPVRITLEKHLPNAAGLGGGTSDAAAVLRGIAQLTGKPPLAHPESIGADLPVCLFGKAARMQGVGEKITPQPGLPALPAVLVNPRLPLTTPEVFRSLERRDNPPLEELPEGLATVQDMAGWLDRQRNDLEAPALRAAPAIAGVLSALAAQPGCLLARMSGSGASCFALFPDLAAAEMAAKRLSDAQPNWWICPTQLA